MVGLGAGLPIHLARLQHRCGHGSPGGHLAGIEIKHHILRATQRETGIIRGRGHMSDAGAFRLGQLCHLRRNTTNQIAAGLKLGGAINGDLLAVNRDLLSHMGRVPLLVLVDGGELHASLTIFGHVNGDIPNGDSIIARVH